MADEGDKLYDNDLSTPDKPCQDHSSIFEKPGDINMDRIGALQQNEPAANYNPNPCDESTILNTSQMAPTKEPYESPHKQTSNSTASILSDGSNQKETSESIDSNLSDRLQQKQTSGSTGSNLSDGSQQKQKSESTGSNLSDGSQQKQTSESTRSNLSDGSQQKQTSESTRSNLSDESQQKQTSESTSSILADGSQQKQTSESTRSNLSDGSQQKQTSESTSSNLADVSQQKQTSDSTRSNLSDGSQQKQTSESTSSNLADGSKQKQTSDSTGSNLSDGAQQKQTSESTGSNLSDGSQLKQTSDSTGSNLSVGAQQKQTSDSTGSNLCDGSQQRKTSESTRSNLSDGSQQKQTSDSTGSNLADGSQQKQTSDSTGSNLSDGSQQKQTSELTSSNLSDVSQQKQTSELTSSNLSDGSQQKQTSESTGPNLSDGSQQKETSESTGSKLSDRAQKKESSKSTGSILSDGSQQKQNATTSVYNLSDVTQQKQRSELNITLKYDVPFQNDTSEPGIHEVLPARDQRFETLHGQTLVSPVRNETVENPHDTTLESIRTDQHVEPTRVAAILKLTTTRTAERFYQERVKREVTSLNKIFVDFEQFCQKKEKNITDSFAKLDKGTKRHKDDEEMYHTLQEDVRHYELRCVFERGRVSVLKEKVTVIIEENTVGLEVAPASISEMKQELTRLRKLTENKTRTYINYSKMLKDHNSKRLFRFAEKEDKLQQELGKLQAEMNETKTRMTDETKKLQKDIKMLEADKNTLNKHLTDARSKLSEQEKDLECFKKMFNTSEIKCKEQKRAIDKKNEQLKGMEEMAAKDMRNQIEIANLTKKLQQQQDDIYKLQNEKQKLYNQSVSWQSDYQEKEAAANHFYNQWQRYSLEYEHSEKQLRDSQEARHQLEQEKKDLVLRLSKIAGANLTYNNPNIADLGDPNRPTKLAEVFSEIYDNEWTDAYETVMDDEEKNKIQFMLKILKDVDTICENVTKRHADAVTDGLTQFIVKFKVRKGPTNPNRESDERALKLVDTYEKKPACTKDALATGKFGNPSAVIKTIKPSTSNKSDGEQGDALALYENLFKENQGTNPSQSENGNTVNQLEDGEKVTSDSNQTDETATENKPPTDNINIKTTESENGTQDKRLEPCDNDSSTLNTTDGQQVEETATNQKHISDIESNSLIQSENVAKSSEKESSTSNKTKGEHSDETTTDDKYASENESTNSIQSKNGAFQLEPGEKGSSALNHTDGGKNAEPVPEEKPPTDNANLNSYENKNEDNLLVLSVNKNSTAKKTDDELGDKADTKHPLDDESINQVQTQSEDENSKIRTLPIHHDLCSLGKCVEKGDRALGNTTAIQDNGRNEQERTENGAEVDFELSEDKGVEVDKYTTTPNTEQEEANNKEKEIGDRALRKSTFIQDNGRNEQEGTEKEAEVDSELGEDKGEEVDKDTTTPNTEQEDADYKEKKKGDGALGKSTAIQDNGRNEQEDTEKEEKGDGALDNTTVTQDNGQNEQEDTENGAEEDSELGEGKYEVVYKDTTTANTEPEDEDLMEKGEYEERSEIIEFKFDELPTAQKQFIEDIRRKVQNDLAEQVIKAIGIAVLEEMGPNQGDEIRNYISKCSLFCWTARSHNPPVYVDFMEVTENMRFDMSVYKPYTKTGPLVDYIVWPPIYLHKGGPMLSKGVAQGRKNN